MNCSFTLLIDDVRDLYADFVCRTYDAAELLIHNVDIQEWKLLLDHDLGSKSKTGYDLVNLMIENMNLPKHIVIVSSNPVGRDNIARALTSTGQYKKLSPYEFKKRGAE